MERADDLYGLPLAGFTPARDALAKELAAAGDGDAAAAVRKLRKPSVPAWAVNQLARRHPAEMAALFEAGDALERAHRLVLQGGDPASMRDATAREREAVGALVALARAILGEAGHQPSPATIEKVSETLAAAATDPDARARAGRGVLDRELERVGFGAFPDLRVVPGEAAEPEREERRARKEAEERGRRESREAELRLAALARDAESAEADVRRLERETAQARERAERARDRAERARSALEEGGER